MRSKEFCPYCSNRLEKKVWNGAVRQFCSRCAEPIYDNPVPAVCAVVADAEDRVMLVRRAVAPKPGLWCLPGGFMELGETPEETTLRELREETGITGEVVSLMGIRATPSRLYHTVLLTGFEVRPSGGAPIPGDDASEIEWFTEASLPDIAFDSHRWFIHRFFHGPAGDETAVS
jgi:ADP-ribose pyrophosphatase YjhB (NUDIX family)